jgi:hypothetical protein
VTAHSHRFGVLQGLDVVRAVSDDEHEVCVGGYPIATKVLVGLAVLSVNAAGQNLGGWNGIDTAELHEFADELLRPVGLR